MKTFKEFLSEAPIPYEDKDEAEKLLYHPPGKYRPNNMIDSFYKKYEILGNDNGSSRIAFRIGVKAGLFKAKDLKDLKTGSDGSVQTAVKLAKNDKGIWQNRVEMEIWNRIKGKDGSQFFCPIIDWAGNKNYNNNIYYDINHSLKTKIGNKTGPFWIQMPLVRTFNYSNNSTLRTIIKETFGSEELPDMYTDLEEVKADFENGNLNEEQFKNNVDLITIAKKESLSDFHYGNIGLYKDDQVVILDYGYNDDTDKIYWERGTGELEITINDNGEVEIEW